MAGGEALFLPVVPPRSGAKSLPKNYLVGTVIYGGI
jgi:hypothetical protein